MSIEMLNRIRDAEELMRQLKDEIMAEHKKVQARIDRIEYRRKPGPKPKVAKSD